MTQENVGFAFVERWQRDTHRTRQAGAHAFAVGDDKVTQRAVGQNIDYRSLRVYADVIAFADPARACPQIQQAASQTETQATEQ